MGFVRGVLWTFDKRACWKWSLETIAGNPHLLCCSLLFPSTKGPDYSAYVSIYLDFFLFRGGNVFFPKSQPFAGIVNPNLTFLASTIRTCSHNKLLCYLQQVPFRWVFLGWFFFLKNQCLSLNYINLHYVFENPNHLLTLQHFCRAAVGWVVTHLPFGWGLPCAVSSIPSARTQCLHNASSHSWEMCLVPEDILSLQPLLTLTVFLSSTSGEKFCFICRVW